LKVFSKLSEYQTDMVKKNISFFLRPDEGGYPAELHTSFEPL
jgi:hypothetical protein